MASPRVVHDAIWTLLEAVPGINQYDGEVSKTPPLDADGRVHAYAVLFYSPGRRHANGLDGAQRSVDGSFQITCVGGDPSRALSCVDKVLTALVGTTVTVDGVPRQIRAREEDPGPVREDRNVTPPRHFVPLQFQLHMP